MTFLPDQSYRLISWVNFHQYCWALSIQFLQLSCIFFSDFSDYCFFSVLAFYAGIYMLNVLAFLNISFRSYYLSQYFSVFSLFLQFRRNFLFLISVLLFQFFTISNISFTMLIWILICHSFSHHSLFNNFRLSLLHKQIQNYTGPLNLVENKFRKFSVTVP